jgi:hypothetical protein
VSNRTGDEAGASSVASVFGVAIFLGFLLIAAQLLVHLYATSTVTAVAFDNARRAAADGGDCSSAVTRARTSLGSWAADPGEVAITCSRDGAFTTVRIAGPSPALALRIYGQMTGQAAIDRGASVRTEGG